MIGTPKIKIFSFFGPPGSGKGTLAGSCHQVTGVPVLSTGNLCRKHVENKTDFGMRFQKYLDEGKLIPDALITEMVIEWMQENQAKKNCVILDGFPRTEQQAVLLQDFLSKKQGEYIFIPVVFDISDGQLRTRLLNRLVCSNADCQTPYSKLCPPQEEGVCDYCHAGLIRRADDVEHVAMQRIVTYREHAETVLAFFKQHCPLSVKMLCDQRSPKELLDAFCVLIGQV